ncbi:hypothetical protein DFQ26_009176 [Actinomortierella ambigua]|nr:hypothetical protein DFQ26_009176 [Actinomortierella ambigua]
MSTPKAKTPAVPGSVSSVQAQKAALQAKSGTANQSAAGNGVKQRLQAFQTGSSNNNNNNNSAGGIGNGGRTSPVSPTTASGASKVSSTNTARSNSGTFKSGGAQSPTPQESPQSMLPATQRTRSSSSTSSSSTTATTTSSTMSAKQPFSVKTVPEEAPAPAPAPAPNTPRAATARTVTPRSTESAPGPAIDPKPASSPSTAASTSSTLQKEAHAPVGDSARVGVAPLPSTPETQTATTTDAKKRKNKNRSESGKAIPPPVVASAAAGASTVDQQTPTPVATPVEPHIPVTPPPVRSSENEIPTAATGAPADAESLHKSGLPSPKTPRPASHKKSIRNQPQKFHWKHGGESVQVTGTFDNWQRTIQMKKIPSTTDEYMATIELDRTQNIYFKFVIDNVWRCSTEFPTVPDDSGNLNNVLYALEPASG